MLLDLNKAHFGSTLRDFTRLAAVIKNATQRNMKIRFTVLASKPNIDLPRSLVGEGAWPAVEGLHGIDDAALLELYHNSDLLFLPLLAATANNALLEAMATGLPMLVSDLPACRAYAGESAWYFPADEDIGSLAERLDTITPESDRLRELGFSARVRAEQTLSWEKISEAHSNFVRAINSNTAWTYET
jgi:glycosyltransferase involved in cell wall biosynthesis